MAERVGQVRTARALAAFCHRLTIRRGMCRVDDRLTRMLLLKALARAPTSYISVPYRVLPGRRLSTMANSQYTGPWTADKVRHTFFDYFEKTRGHTYVPSSSTIPHEDPTLLFANAGMNQVRAAILGPTPRLLMLVCSLKPSSLARSTQTHLWPRGNVHITAKNVFVLVENTTVRVMHFPAVCYINMSPQTLTMSARTRTTTPSSRCLVTGHSATISR